LKKVAFVFDSLALVWFVDELRGEIEWQCCMLLWFILLAWLGFASSFQTITRMKVAFTTLETSATPPIQPSPINLLPQHSETGTCCQVSLKMDKWSQFKFIMQSSGGFNRWKIYLQVLRASIRRGLIRDFWINFQSKKHRIQIESKLISPSSRLPSSNCVCISSKSNINQSF
jgi:hypothetical protein